MEQTRNAIDYWHADEGFSGSTPALQRSLFKAILDMVRKGEKLVFAKLYRPGRNAQDVGATIKLLKGRKVAVVVLQLGNLNLTIPSGKLMLQMLAAMARMERDLLIE